MKVQRGQALVLVLLSLAVVLTLVLFILSRSVTDISVSSKNEEAIRAFSAAEAGVENALVIGTGTNETTIGNAKYTSAVTAYAKDTKDFVYPIEMGSGDTATTWFTDHDATTSVPVCDATHTCFTGNTFKVCWGKPGTLSAVAVTPAVELIVFYETTPGNIATTKIARAAFDPYLSRAPANSFAGIDAGACTVGGVTYPFQKQIQFSDLGIPLGTYSSQGGLQFAKVRMLYNTNTTQNIATTVDFAGNSNLPSQGQAIVATGTAGESNRKINVFQGWPEAPSVFDGAVYSSVGLTK